MKRSKPLVAAATYLAVTLFVGFGAYAEDAFGAGSGFDRVQGFGQVVGGTQGLDKIRLDAGVAACDLLVQIFGGHLTLTIRDTGDTLRLENWYGTAALGARENRNV